jgi:hypothetical protein
MPLSATSITAYVNDTDPEQRSPVFSGVFSAQAGADQTGEFFASTSWGVASTCQPLLKNQV